MAANTIFLELDKIKGNATHALFKDLIALDSYSFSASIAVTEASSNSERTLGNTTAGDITCTKEQDLSSTELYQHCLYALNIESAILHVGKNTGKDADWQYSIIYKLEDVLIRSISTSCNGGIPYDTFVLNYSKITGTYTKQNIDTGKVGNADFVWDKAITSAKGTKVKGP